MKTLIIHPKDATTDMLCRIYKDTDWTIINYNPSTSHLKKEIASHDRIIMLGHGTPQGLIGERRLVVNSDLIYLLRDKELTAVWCNADQFFKKYDLKGFYTGMIISEYEEALAYCISNFNYQHVHESNELFSDLMKEIINLNYPEMVKTMNEKYISDNNPIIQFNTQNIYCNLK